MHLCRLQKGPILAPSMRSSNVHSLITYTSAIYGLSVLQAVDNRVVHLRSLLGFESASWLAWPDGGAAHHLNNGKLKYEVCTYGAHEMPRITHELPINLYQAPSPPVNTSFLSDRINVWIPYQSVQQLFTFCSTTDRNNITRLQQPVAETNRHRHSSCLCFYTDISPLICHLSSYST